MDKRRVDEYIPKAYDAIKKCDILKDQKIANGFRGQIAAFGAMVAMGSILSAIALYNNQGDSLVDRSKLIKAIAYIVMGEDFGEKDLFFYVQKKIKEKNEKNVKEKILDAAIAIKLAMNLYEIEK